MSDVPLADRDLAALVPEWLDWSQVAELLGVTPGKVRTMIRDHELAQAVSGPGAGPRVPADFIQDGQVVNDEGPPLPQESALAALAEVGGRRRSILWQSNEVLAALDGFAERAGWRWVG